MTDAIDVYVSGGAIDVDVSGVAFAPASSGGGGGFDRDLQVLDSAAAAYVPDELTAVWRDLAGGAAAAAWDIYSGVDRDLSTVTHPIGSSAFLGGRAVIVKPDTTDEDPGVGSDYDGAYTDYVPDFAAAGGVFMEVRVRAHGDPYIPDSGVIQDWLWVMADASGNDYGFRILCDDTDRGRPAFAMPSGNLDVGPVAAKGQIDYTTMHTSRLEVWNEGGEGHYAIKHRYEDTDDWVTCASADGLDEWTFTASSHPLRMGHGRTHGGYLRQFDSAGTRLFNLDAADAPTDGTLDWDDEYGNACHRSDRSLLLAATDRPCRTQSPSFYDILPDRSEFYPNATDSWSLYLDFVWDPGKAPSRGDDEGSEGWVFIDLSAYDLGTGLIVFAGDGSSQNAGVTNLPLVTGHRHQLMAVLDRDLGTFTVYLDGEFVGQSPVAADPIPWSTSTTWDLRPGYGTPQVNGGPIASSLLGPVVAWTRALSTAEVLAVHRDPRLVG